jgi:hypothetical protein
LPQSLLKPGLDSEKVSSVLCGSNRSHLADSKQDGVTSDTGDNKLAGLSDPDATNVSLIYLQYDAVGFQWRNFKEFFPLFYRRANQLAQVTGNDNAIKRGDNPRTRQLVLSQGQLCLGLLYLSVQNLYSRQIMLGHCLA